MGTAVHPAKTSPGPWDAFADVDVFVDEVLAELTAMAKDSTRPQRSGPKPPLAGAALRKVVAKITHENNGMYVYAVAYPSHVGNRMNLAILARYLLFYPRHSWFVFLCYRNGPFVSADPNVPGTGWPRCQSPDRSAPTPDPRR